MRISFSKDARNDLERLNGFISSKNPIVAKRIINKLIEGIEVLTNYPELGIEVKKSPRPELLRDVFILDYHIRYLILKHSIQIVRIWHQKEDR